MAIVIAFVRSLQQSKSSMWGNRALVIMDGEIEEWISLASLCCWGGGGGTNSGRKTMLEFGLCFGNVTSAKKTEKRKWAAEHDHRK